jgi:hypothetical protein
VDGCGVAAAWLACMWGPLTPESPSPSIPARPGPACPSLPLLARPRPFSLPPVPPGKQDYSFLDTPQLDVDLGDTNTTIVPRLALPNPRLPAYLSGKISWGTPPTLAVSAGRLLGFAPTSVESSLGA